MLIDFCFILSIYEAEHEMRDARHVPHCQLNCAPLDPRHRHAASVFASLVDINKTIVPVITTRQISTMRGLAAVTKYPKYIDALSHFT